MHPVALEEPPPHRVRNRLAAVAVLVGLVLVVLAGLAVFGLGVSVLEAVGDTLFARNVPDPRTDYLLVVGSCALVLWAAAALLALFPHRRAHTAVGAVAVVVVGAIVLPLLPARYSDERARDLAAAMDRGLTADQFHALEYGALVVALGSLAAFVLLPVLAGRVAHRARTGARPVRQGAYAAVVAVPVVALVAGGLGWLAVRDLHSGDGNLAAVAKGFRTDPGFVLSSGETVTSVVEPGCSAAGQRSVLGASRAHCLRTLQVTIATAGGSWTYGFEEFVVSGQATSAAGSFAAPDRRAVAVQHIVLTYPAAAPQGLTREVGDALAYVQLGLTN